MSYDKYFPYSGGVSHEFEQFVNEHRSMFYSLRDSETVVPGSLKIHFNPTDNFSEVENIWGQHALPEDISIHWHLSFLRDERPSTIYRNRSLLRGTQIIYTGIARHGHSKVPISPDLVIHKDRDANFRKSERYHKQELESLLSRLNFH